VDAEPLAGAGENICSGVFENAARPWSMTISAVTTLVPSYAIQLPTADRNMAETGAQQIASSHAPSASGTGVQTLSGKALLDALKMILPGAPLVEVLTSRRRVQECCARFWRPIGLPQFLR